MYAKKTRPGADMSGVGISAGGGYIQGMGMSSGYVLTPFLPPYHPPETWDTMGYSRPAAGTHPTGMLSCLIN